MVVKQFQRTYEDGTENRAPYEKNIIVLYAKFELILFYLKLYTSNHLNLEFFFKKGFLVTQITKVELQRSTVLQDLQTNNNFKLK